MIFFCGRCYVYGADVQYLAMSSQLSAINQEFLALLVSRGYLLKKDAESVLFSSSETDFETHLAEIGGFSQQDLEHLRRTRAMKEPMIPGYVIQRLIGRGGTAEVFAAKRERDFEPVALKILLPRLAQDSVSTAQFVKEGKLLANLKIPHIVKGYRVFRFLKTYILEMELAEGQTLLEWLDQGRSFDERESLDIVYEIATALEGMRKVGVIHRDLKPGNIMLDRSGNVRLIDLGFAGEGLSGGHGEGTTMGTAAYLAPEQARGESDLDSRSDIYSLGVTLYQLVLGELPFKASDDQEMLRKQVLDSLKGSSVKGGGVSPHVHYFLEKMMAKDREFRFSSPSELLDALEAHFDTLE